MAQIPSQTDKPVQHVPEHVATYTAANLPTLHILTMSHLITIQAQPLLMVSRQLQLLQSPESFVRWRPRTITKAHLLMHSL